MSNAYPRRPYAQQQRKAKPSAPITAADLARHGIPPASSRPSALPAAAPAVKPKPAASLALNPRLWRVVERVEDKQTGTRKSTRILGLPGGVLVNTCTRGAAGVSEALVFVPGTTPADFPA